VKYSFLAVFFLLFLASCNNQKQAFRELELSDSSSYFIDFTKPISHNFSKLEIKKDTLIFVNDTAIYITNMNDNICLFDFKLPYKFVDVFYHNYDSIFVIANPYITDIDSIIRLMNHKGEVVKYYSLNNTNLLDSNQTLKTHPIDLAFTNNKLIISLKRLWSDLIGDEEFIENITPLVAIFDLETNNISFVDMYEYPILGGENKFNSAYFKQNITLFSKNHVLLSFSYTPITYKININTKEFEENCIKSYVLETFPFNKNINLTQPIYDEFMTVKSSNNFFRRIIYGRGTYFGGYLYFDNNFNEIGEFVCPKNTNLAYADDEFIYLFDGRLPYSNSSFTITRYKYKYKSTDLNKWLEKKGLLQVKNEIITECNYQIDSIQKTNLKPYIDKHIQDSSFSIIIVPVGLTCPKCVAKKNNIITDTTADFFNYKKGFIGVQYLIIHENKIIFDKTYQADELNELVSKDLFSYIDSLIIE